MMVRAHLDTQITPYGVRPRGDDLPASAADPVAAHSAFRAMGCHVTLTLCATTPSTARTPLDEARRFFEWAEACLSRFRPESEPSRLNRRVDSWVPASPLLGQVLRRALRAARETGGLCTPTKQSALEAAGYDRDFQALAPVTMEPDTPLGKAARLAVSATALRRARAAQPGLPRRPRQTVARRLRSVRPRVTGDQSWRRIRFSRDGGRVSMPAGVRLDLAGVAKGWTADRVADLLAAYGSCLVDAGGDLAARVAPGDAAAWPIAVESPFESGVDLSLVLLRNQGIATSGSDFRRWSVGGEQRHHLIDPRTGAPSQSDVCAATVIAPTTVSADVHAKTALLLGAVDGYQYLTCRGLAGLIVRDDRTVIVTPAWSSFAYAG